MGNTEFRQLKSNNTAYKYYVEIHVFVDSFYFQLAVFGCAYSGKMESYVSNDCCRARSASFAASYDHF